MKQHRVAGFSLFALVASLLAGWWAAPTSALSTSLVISQVYGGGGATSGSPTYKNDFIELFNTSNVTVSLNGYSVQYGSATGSSWQATSLTGAVDPGHYFLVQEGGGTVGGTLPPADAIGTLNMSATAGKVALVNSATALTGGCPTVPVVDLLGYGTANCSEGSPTAALTNVTAATRTNSCVDTDQNSTDFTVITASARNSSTPANPCSPLPTATNTLIPPTATDTAVPTATATSDPNSTPTATSIATATSTASPTNTSTSTPTNTGVPPTATATSAPLTPIYTIQGAAQRSSLTGKPVTTQGVVTGVKVQTSSSGAQTFGFFLQDAVGDGNIATSDAILVYTGSSRPVATLRSYVGHSLQVAGTISEYVAGTGSSPVTELGGSLIITDLGQGPAITPVVIGMGGWMPPTTVIDDDNNTTYDPTTDGLDFYESLESMLVQVNNGLVVGPTNQYGEFVVVADRGANATGLTAQRSLAISPNDFNPERIMIGQDNIDVAPATGGNGNPALTVGDVTSGAVIGPLDYNFNNYKIERPATPLVIDTTTETTPEVTAPLTSNSQLRVASFNVENFFNIGDPGEPQRIQRVADDIRVNLGAPDVLVVDEIQDDSGRTDDGTVTAESHLTTLTDMIKSGGGPQYQWRYINPVNDQDGGEPGGNIRVVFLFRADRGLTFVDKPGGGPTIADSVNPDGTLAQSPGRVDPNNPAFTSSRKPLAGEFLFNGHDIIIIGNHWNSKGGDQPLYGSTQPPVQSSQTQRDQQATVVRSFVDQIFAGNPNANVVVAGDLNDFQFSPPLTIVKGSGSTALMDLVERPEVANEVYTYNYEGNAQVLDHILYSQALAQQLTTVDIVHLDSSFPVGVRASDHDPDVANFDLPASATPTPTSTNTSVPTATNTPSPTNTPTATNTAVPTATNTPSPTSTPTATNTSLPTATNTPLPTATNTPSPMPTDATPSVTANAATVVANEGKLATLTGTYSDADAGDKVTLTVSVGMVTKNGTNSGTWRWFFPTTDGPADGQIVTLTATDSEGATATTSWSLTVRNVAPTATLTNSGPVSPGDTVFVSFTNTSDPSSADTSAGFHYAFACGDPTQFYQSTYANSSTTPGTSCSFDSPGAHSVLGRIIDKDGGYADYSTVVRVRRH
ncbi:MAG: lamin tail domain-containing protein [Herpetosiphonaceae bacterium]|nr:lamin tail domain-containing protein [Herpetosiphonaceae bacterium]